MPPPLAFGDRLSQEVRRHADSQSAIREYYWLYFWEIAHQISVAHHDLTQALASRTARFTFENWCRIVDYQHSNQPLSARGSVLNDPGGRFNIGTLDTYRFQPFPVLYLGESFAIAYKEKFGQTQPRKPSSRLGGLSENELALVSGQSFSEVSVEGEIREVLDINKPTSLSAMTDLVKGFRLSPALRAKAKQLGLAVPCWITSTSALQLLLAPNWRTLPQLVDVPAPSQVFGQIARAAGIEGILYGSKMSAGQGNCLALFPENFRYSSSFVRIQGEVPAATEYPVLDRHSWNKVLWG